LGVATGMTEKHWKIVNWLRETTFRTNRVPTVFETCKQNNVTIEELEQLFPSGFQRGAVKVAGLRVL
jgi:tRNA 2-thiouridine synthesizing protein E